MKFPTANKDLGQHYLRDQHIITKITNAHHEEADAILEVGPGPGVLSGQLKKWNKPYKVIEADERFRPNLEEILSTQDINFADALSFDYLTAWKEWGWEDKKVWLVSNLPYNISAPLTVTLLSHSPIKWMTLMYQKEVAQKIIGEEMNSLCALCGNFFQVKSLAKVPPGAFAPPPKVDSQVIDFQRKVEPEISVEEFDQLEGFLRKLFAQRRKQLGTVLKSHYSKEEINSAFEKIGIETRLRGEVLTFEQVILLYRELEQ